MVGGGRVHDRAILDALENFDPEVVETMSWRVVRRGRDPLRGAIASGRWNAIGELDVLYTSLTPEGALAEVGYRLSLEPVWPSRIDHQIHTLKVVAGRALKIESIDELEKLGVDPSRFSSFEYASTQAIAAAAHFLEFDALVVPSARYPVSNLVLFLDRLRTPPELIDTDSIDWQKWRASGMR
jgi:RES domain-containing protein